MISNKKLNAIATLGKLNINSFFEKERKREREKFSYKQRDILIKISLILIAIIGFSIIIKI